MSINLEDWKNEEWHRRMQSQMESQTLYEGDQSGDYSAPYYPGERLRDEWKPPEAYYGEETRQKVTGQYTFLRPTKGFQVTGTQQIVEFAEGTVVTLHHYINHPKFGECYHVTVKGTRQPHYWVSTSWFDL